MSRSLYFFGDSICFGQFVSTHRVWTTQVSSRLEAIEQYSDVVVQVTAVNGETSEGALDRLEYCVLSHRPSVVWVQFGLNDANCWISDGGRPRVSLSSFVENLRTIIRSCLDVGVGHVLLSTNHEVVKRLAHEPDGGRYRSNALRYNEAIRALSKELDDSRSSLVDVQAEFDACGFRADEMLLTDGVHLNHRGHDMYLQVALKPICAALDRVQIRQT